jgi:hypothetical protein
MSRGQGYLAKGHFPEVEEGYDYRVGPVFKSDTSVRRNGDIGMEE